MLSTSLEGGGENLVKGVGGIIIGGKACLSWVDFGNGLGMSMGAGIGRLALGLFLNWDRGSSAADRFSIGRGWVGSLPPAGTFIEFSAGSSSFGIEFSVRNSGFVLGSGLGARSLGGG
jgi:hypothetical protein